ncbi:MAG: DUF1211 domain-containing protein [Calditrichaeota bacterium]|nr:MAG: DUF1211 domain-containing protein [Calditrichota bacterium]
MIRQQAIKNEFGKNDFRWRGNEVSRVEGLSDAVFAIAIALLIVSLEVPKTFNELQLIMEGFVSFGVTFLVIFAIWFRHYKFFRHYGVSDTKMIILNGFLLFFVLFYIYPLKFLTTLLIDSLLLKEILGFNISVNISIVGEQVPTLMIIYSSGFFAIATVLTLMYFHVLTLKEKLELNQYEISQTKLGINAFLICVVISFLSVCIAFFGEIEDSKWAGMIYWLIGPLEAANSIYFSRKFKNKNA